MDVVAAMGVTATDVTGLAMAGVGGRGRVGSELWVAGGGGTGVRVSWAGAAMAWGPELPPLTVSTTLIRIHAFGP